MPRLVDGQWMSDDGHWRWDGREWQPVPPGPPRTPNLWLLLGLYLAGVVVAIVVFRAIGWLVAIAGAVLVVVSALRPGLRSWVGWRRLPGLSGSAPAAVFALVLALYTVLPHPRPRPHRPLHLQPRRRRRLRPPAPVPRTRTRAAATAPASSAAAPITGRPGERRTARRSSAGTTTAGGGSRPEA